MMKTQKRFFISLLALISYMILIFYLSSLPNKALNPELVVGLDIPSMFMHVVEYAILGILMSVVATRFFHETFSIFCSSSILSMSYGILDEVHQFFVPTRYCTLIDVYSDITGSVISVLFYIFMTKLKKKQ